MFELISNSSDIISQENNGTILSYISDQLQRCCEFYGAFVTSDCIFLADEEKMIIRYYFHININSPFINTGSCSWLCCSYIILINWYKFNICLPGFNRHNFPFMTRFIRGESFCWGKVCLTLLSADKIHFKTHLSFFLSTV